MSVGDDLHADERTRQAPGSAADTPSRWLIFLS
jgi:hypothetical protein